VVICDTDIP